MRAQKFWRVVINPNVGLEVATHADLHFVEQVVGAEYSAKASCIPYCINYDTNTIIYSVGLDQIAAASVPFHYKYLRDHTTLVTSIPLELRLKYNYQLTVDPIFIFSPGRCGSTLVARLIRRMGLTCVAESDIFSDAVIYATNRYLNRNALRTARLALRCATYDLVHSCRQGFRDPVVLKLRSQANLNPSHILAVCNARPRTIFIVRRFIPWAISRWRAFGFSTTININHYIKAIHALNWLKANTELLLLKYEELLPPVNLPIYSRLCRFVGGARELSSEDIGGILSDDSQIDTELGRQQIVRKPTEDLVHELETLWTENKPQRLLDDLGIGDL